MRRFAKIQPDFKAETKLCPDCLTIKPFSDFPLRKNTGKIYTYCNECSAKRARAWSSGNKVQKAATNAAWAEANKEHVRKNAKARYYRAAYGMTLEEVAEKLEQQNFSCAICETGINEGTLVIDHCHGHGHIRDLLCNRCNISLAPLEREGFLEKALAYLERHRSVG